MREDKGGGSVWKEKLSRSAVRDVSTDQPMNGLVSHTKECSHYPGRVRKPLKGCLCVVGCDGGGRSSADLGFRKTKIWVIEEIKENPEWTKGDFKEAV